MAPSTLSASRSQTGTDWEDGTDNSQWEPDALGDETEEALPTDSHQPGAKRNRGKTDSDDVGIDSDESPLRDFKRGVGTAAARPSKSSAARRIDYLGAEVDRIDGECVICWVEITAGVRVKTSLPINLFGGGPPKSEDLFHWSPRLNRVSMLPVTDDDLDREIEALETEWTSELQSQWAGTANDVLTQNG